MKKIKDFSAMGCFCAVGIALIALKLVGVITWSWWLVTLPFWGGVALCVLLFVAVLIYAWYDNYRWEKEHRL